MASGLMKYNPAFLEDETLIQSFVARHAELERILEVLRENTGGSNQHLLVIGPRGIGKTTLVLRAAAQIRAEPALGEVWHPIVFGEETYQASTPGEFWLEALFHLGQQTGASRWQRAYDELLLEQDEGRLRQRVLAQLMDFADEQKKRLVLVVENLNMLIGAQIGGEDVWVLRHTLMNEPRLMLIGTATSRFREMEEYDQALYELFRIIELDPLDQAEARALWTAVTGDSVTARKIRPLQILTGGNPRLIRILSEFAASTSFQSLMSDLTRLVDEHTEYFKHHLDNLAPQERKVFVALADLWDPSTARKVAEAARLDVNLTSALLKRLVERGAVTVPYKRGRAQYYQVAERMYNIYHLMRRRGAAASRVHAVVRFMVSFYRDDDLVKTTRSLVEEAARLASDQRQEHFLVYEAILDQVREPRLAARLVEVTRSVFKAMRDLPASLQRLIGVSPALDSAELTNADREALLNLDVKEIQEVNTLLLLAELLSEQNNRMNEAEEAFRKVLQLDPENAYAWHLFGLFLGGRAGRPDEALSAYDRALALDPEDATAWNNRGAVLSGLERNEEALEAFDRALEVDPENATTWANRSAALGRLGRIQEALESVNRALALDPEGAHAWINRGAAYADLGLYQEALESYDRALALEPENVTAWVNRGSTLRSLERNEEALDIYNRVLAANPERVSAWIDAGNILFDLGRTEDALRFYDHAVALNPRNAIAWINRGNALNRLHRNSEALEAFDRALTVEPENVRAFTSRSIVLNQLGRHAEAIEVLDHVLSMDPQSATAWVERGNALGRLGRDEEALESVDHALALDATNATAWLNRGAALGHLGRDEEALQAFDHVLRLEPENASAWFNRGWAYHLLKQPSRAAQDFRRAIALGVEEILAAEILVELLLNDLQLPSEAISVAWNTIEQSGDSPQVLNSMAWAFFEYGTKENWGEAEGWARRAVTQMPENAAFRHTLASLLGAQGQWSEALEEASRFLEDSNLLATRLDQVLDFFIEAVAAGHENEVVRIIEAAGAAERLEPLLVAIRQMQGALVDVAREIAEVAKDVTRRIEERRA